MKKVIAISGVPGTGKTDVARILAEEIGATLLSINDIIEREKVKFEWDKKRGSKIISIPSLQKAVAKSTAAGLNVVEGLLAHTLKSDTLVVLRCDPLVLKKRLQKRKWDRAKITENVAAEALGVITAESANKRKVYEIDTTKLAPEKAAAIIENILKDSRHGKRYLPGKIDWLGKYGKRAIQLV
jgi:adenylate kinase